MPSATVATIDGRTIDLLGRVQQVSLDVSTAGTRTLIFTTDNTDFRGKNVFVAYVVIESGDGQPFSTNCAVGLGSGSTRDWLGVGASALIIGGQASPIVCWNGQNVIANNTFGLVLYGSGVAFNVQNVSGDTYAPLATVSAYGFAYG